MPRSNRLVFLQVLMLSMMVPLVARMPRELLKPNRPPEDKSA
jgi:hypothetical protein